MARKILGFVGKLVAGLILFVLLLSLITSGITALQNNTVGDIEVEGSAAWMDSLPDQTLISDLAIPGTHDSATKYVQLSLFSKCQGTDITTQLNDGYRYLDIRLGDDEEGNLNLMHGFTKCKRGLAPWSANLTVNNVMRECVSFLKSHPGETIIFAVKYEHGDMEIANFQQLLNHYINLYDPDRMWYLEDRVPTLGEVRGRIVLARRYEDEAGLGDKGGLSLIWPDQPGSEEETFTAELTENTSNALYVQDRYEYGNDAKWEAYQFGIEGFYADEDAGFNETDTPDIRLNFLSTKGTYTYGHPYRHAKVLNKNLLSYEETENTFYGWTIVDFGNAGIAEKIYSTNVK